MLLLATIASVGMQRCSVTFATLQTSHSRCDCRHHVGLQRSPYFERAVAEQRHSKVGHVVVVRRETTRRVDTSKIGCGEGKSFRHATTLCSEDINVLMLLI